MLSPAPTSAALSASSSSSTSRHHQHHHHHGHHHAHRSHSSGSSSASSPQAQPQQPEGRWPAANTASRGSSTSAVQRERALSSRSGDSSPSVSLLGDSSKGRKRRQSHAGVTTPQQAEGASESDSPDHGSKEPTSAFGTERRHRHSRPSLSVSRPQFSDEQGLFWELPEERALSRTGSPRQQSRANSPPLSAQLSPLAHDEEQQHESHDAVHSLSLGVAHALGVESSSPPMKPISTDTTLHEPPAQQATTTTAAVAEAVPASSAPNDGNTSSVPLSPHPVTIPPSSSILPTNSLGSSSSSSASDARSPERDQEQHSSSQQPSEHTNHYHHTAGDSSNNARPSEHRRHDVDYDDDDDDDDDHYFRTRNQHQQQQPPAPPQQRQQHASDSVTTSELFEHQPLPTDGIPQAVENGDDDDDDDDPDFDASWSAGSVPSVPSFEAPTNPLAATRAFGSSIADDDDDDDDEDEEQQGEEVVDLRAISSAEEHPSAPQRMTQRAATGLERPLSGVASLSAHHSGAIFRAIPDYSSDDTQSLATNIQSTELESNTDDDTDAYLSSDTREINRSLSMQRKAPKPKEPVPITFSDMSGTLAIVSMKHRARADA